MSSSSPNASGGSPGGAPAVAARIAARTAAGAALVIAASGAGAANWDYQPRIELGTTYDDNYRLAEATSDRIKVGGALLDAQLAVHSISPRSDWAVVPRVRSTWFPSHSSEQSTDGFLTLEGESRTQKSTLGATAAYSNQSVVLSELLPATFPGVQLGQAVGGEGGRVNVRNRQQLLRLAPTWAYDWTQRRRLRLDGEYSKVRYDKTLFEQVGFQNLSGSAGMQFQTSLRSLFTVRGIASRFEPDSGGANTNTYGAEGQWDLRHSDITRFYLRAGANRSNAQVGGRSVSDTGVVGGAGLIWTYPISEFVLDAVRSLQPSSYGAVMTRDELRFRMNRNLRPRLKGYVALRGIRMTGAQSGVTIQNRDYATGETGFEWQMTRDYRIVGLYDYTWQRFQGEPTAAANAVAFSIVYQPASRFEPITPARTY